MTKKIGFDEEKIFGQNVFAISSQFQFLVDLSIFTRF